MNKNSNVQRIETLRLWILSNIKNKTRDCQMFVNPQKRKAASPHDINVPKLKEYEVDLQRVIEDDMLNT